MSVTPRFALAVQRRVVNDHVEHTSVAHDDAKVADEVLVVAEQVVGRAHGASRIVSGNAVDDLDLVGHQTRLLAPAVPADRWSIW